MISRHSASTAFPRSEARGLTDWKPGAMSMFALGRVLVLWQKQPFQNSSWVLRR